MQGFLFFGTASRLIEDIRGLLIDTEREKIRYLVLDFKHVVAMDTSAVNSFAKLLQVCRKEDVTLVMTGCSPAIRDRFAASIAKGDDGESPLNLFEIFGRRRGLVRRSHIGGIQFD